jgi:hypothetical protein
MIRALLGWEKLIPKWIKVFQRLASLLFR